MNNTFSEINILITHKIYKQYLVNNENVFTHLKCNDTMDY